MIGKLSHDENMKMISQSHMLLNPSFLEGLPGVVLEAINFGCIPLVSNVGGNNELVTIPELLFDLKTITPQSLAQQVIDITQHATELIPKLEKTQTTCQKYYRWSRVISDYISNNIL
jgi:glycosyltransferase involved in cell wall biosynthesis